MGTFNYLHALFKCPFCGHDFRSYFELKFGFRNQLHFKIGDTYPWLDDDFPGAKVIDIKPPGGNLDGSAYGECQVCGRDFWVIVKIRDGIIHDIVYDSSRKGYSDLPNGQ